MMRALASQGLRRTINDDEWENRIYDVIDCINDSMPEIIYQSEEAYKALGISVEEARKRLETIRDKWNDDFPLMKEEKGLLSGHLIHFYLSNLPNPYSDDDFDSKKYFAKHLTEKLRTNIYNSVLKAGYSIEEALIPLMSDTHEVLCLVDS